ncbi:hypothetical protein ZWY2020_020072 [Hordeum vulgare]|nr:hypothetical protein ZWY2020_020072 [Hordeum vulgare]
MGAVLPIPFLRWMACKAVLRLVVVDLPPGTQIWWLGRFGVLSWRRSSEPRWVPAPGPGAVLVAARRNYGWRREDITLEHRSMAALEGSQHQPLSLVASSRSRRIWSCSCHRLGSPAPAQVHMATAARLVRLDMSSACSGSTA